MSRKLPLGRRHKNGTGNNKKVAAKREIVRTKKKAKKNAKKKTTVLVCEHEVASIEATHKAEVKEIVERGVQAVEDAQLKHWCALPPTRHARAPSTPCPSPHARRPPGLPAVLLAASVVHCPGPRATRIRSPRMLLGAT